MKPLTLLMICFVAFCNADRNLDHIRYRLDDSVIPLHYDLKLTPHLSFEENENLFDFEGEVDIRVKSVKPDVTTFSLHSEELTITSVTLKDAESQEDVTFTKNLPGTLNPKLVIRPEIALKENGEYILSIEYNGKIRTDLDGFYKSQYVNDDGNKIYIGVTQFQASDARKAFPCFDEPKFKATFTVSINRHNKYKAYSNTKINYSTPIEGTDRTVDVFKQTPKMSTYTLAFLVTDYEERNIADNLTILVQPKQFQEADLAFNYSMRLMDFFDEYTEIPYSSIDGIEKMDLVSIPDFSAGAMENWGLVTFSKNSLLCKLRCVEESKIYRTNTIAHEFAHMWFGNLVTCEWWSYTWLNEAFANYFAHYALIETVPDWNTELQFVMHSMGNAFRSDFGKHSLTNRDVYSTRDIDKMFSTITYDKGGSVVRMFDHLLGQDSFQKAIRKYLNDHKYGNVTPEDLYEALSKEWHNSEVDLHEIFTDWTEQSGYPIVTVELSEDGKTINIRQEQFYIDERKKDNITRQWIIPLTFTTNHETDFKNTQPKEYLLKNGPQEIHLDQPAEWVIFNIRQTGYYRVNYDEKTWLKIGQALRQENLGEIDVINRAKIVSDLFTYSRQNLVSYGVLLEFLTYLEFESQVIPWEASIGTFIQYYKKLSDDDLNKFQKYIQPLLSKIYNEVKSHIWPQKVDTNSKQNIARAACLLGAKECISKSKVIVEAAILQNSTVESLFEQTAFMVVMMYDSEHYYDKVYEYFNSEFSPVKFTRPIFSCTKDENQFLNYLNSTLHNSTDISLAQKFESILDLGCANRELAFDFVIEHLESITKMSSEFKKETILRSLAGVVTNSAQKEKLQNAASSVRGVNYAIRDANKGIKWYEDVGSKISKYLNEKYPDVNVVQVE